MQFKLYNFHKFVGNFATSLVGTFIPLIIYKVTGSLRLAVLFLFGQCLCRLISNHLFKNFISKYPQIALMVRVVPLLIYNLALIFQFFTFWFFGGFGRRFCLQNHSTVTLLARFRGWSGLMLFKTLTLYAKYCIGEIAAICNKNSSLS